MRNSVQPFLIGIAGGSCCGKTEVCSTICKELEQNTGESSRVTVLAHKSFYRELTDDERELAQNGKFNFDHPTAFDDDLLLHTLTQLKSGKEVQIPKYNVVTHSRESDYQTINPSDVILFEGILTLYNKEVRELLCLLYTSPSPRDATLSRMPSSA